MNPFTSTDSPPGGSPWLDAACAGSWSLFDEASVGPLTNHDRPSYHAAEIEAAAMCAGCPITVLCRESTLEWERRQGVNSVFSVAGGLNERQRRAILKAERKASA